MDSPMVVQARPPSDRDLFPNSFALRFQASFAYKVRNKVIAKYPALLVLKSRSKFLLKVCRKQPRGHGRVSEPDRG